MKLLTLAKKLDFTCENDYFDYCAESYYNGNFTQCKELFKAMTKADRKLLITYLSENYPTNKDLYNCYFEML